ncbi:MAG: SsrA-binding protein SmpB [Erysipelotrichaceae bacterium]|nr:SsrA-binding protein SmpB [Erysipelotrichaceae bacterium]
MANKNKGREESKNNCLLASNRKASFNYFLSDFEECGIALLGTEIKALRVKGCSIGDAYILIRNGEAEIVNMHIPTYDHGNIFNHDPLRTRKLLLHKKQIRWFDHKTNAEGYTIVPTKVYLKKGRCKVEIALAKGKKNYDKKEAIKNRDIEREVRRGDY